jgi:non-canonical poly(A) RNA polymerase PAPD5/7
VEIHVVGSFATELNLPMSDVDLVVGGVSVASPLAALYELAQALRPFASRLEVISGAAVPIIKMLDGYTGIPVDITVGVLTGIASTKLVKEYLVRYPDATPLILFCKHLLLSHGLNTLFTGGLPSYNVTLLVIAFLRYQQQRSASTQDASQGLGRLLLAFLELFGFEFPYDTSGVSLREGRWVLDKRKSGYFNKHSPQLLCLEDPLREGIDLGAKCFAMDKVRGIFAHAFTEIVSALPVATAARLKRESQPAVESVSSSAPTPLYFLTLARLLPYMLVPVARTLSLARGNPHNGRRRVLGSKGKNSIASKGHTPRQQLSPDLDRVPKCVKI